MRTIATSSNTIKHQVCIINDFTSQHHLNLNNTKTEVIKFSQQPYCSETININNCDVCVATEVKCLGTWFTNHLSAQKSVHENICKARKAFFGFGSIEAFQGNLNPLSAVNIYNTCVLPILLYGSDTWLLDSTTLLQLEQFQYEIGRRILKLSKLYSGTVVHICLGLPSIASIVLLRKLRLLAKLIMSKNNSISSRVLIS